MLTSALLLLELVTDPAEAGMDVGLDILLRKRFQRFHRGTESESGTDGTLLLLLPILEDEDRTNVGLARLFGENLPVFDNRRSRDEDKDLPTLALGAKAST
jgi:hypothetical protein